MRELIIPRMFDLLSFDGAGSSRWLPVRRLLIGVFGISETNAKEIIKDPTQGKGAEAIAKLTDEQLLHMFETVCRQFAKQM